MILQVGDVNDDGSDENEDFPLLRKSPDSGSYVSLAMDSDKETKQVPEASNAPFKGETRHNASNNTQDGAGVISDKVNTEQSSTLNDISKDDKTLDDDEMPSEHGSIPDIIDHLNNGALSTEYNDPEYDKLCESCVVNAGLNQSVSSISENPSYSYGNQMEYSPYSGYEYGYSRNSFGNDVIKDNTLDINCADDSGLVSNFLENEGNYRENGSCDEITNGLSDNLSNHIDLPEKVSSIHTRYKGGQANDGETTDTSLDKGLSESTVDPNECLSVVSHQPVWATDQSVV